jgi:hypothetical protein
LSVVPLSFSAIITGVMGGFTKRKAMTERNRQPKMTRTMRPMRLNQGCRRFAVVFAMRKALYPPVAAGSNVVLGSSAPRY